MNGIEIPTNRGKTLVQVDNILRIQSSSNYSRIYFADNRYPLTVAKILQWFETQLPAGLFLRTHRAHIVNRQYISEITPRVATMTLINGEKIGISKRRKTGVLRQLRNELPGPADAGNRKAG